MDMSMLFKVRHVMAAVMDEAEADGVQLTPEQAFIIALKRHEENQDD